MGGFGISPAEDLLLIEDFCLVKQRCTAVTVKFDDEAVADFFDDQVDRGLVPEQFGRIWIHTHPGNSPEPSTTDEETFARCFGSTDWAVMLIVARGGETYARLRFRAGPSGSLQLPVEIDFAQPFPASQEPSWDAEYDTSVVAAEPFFEWGSPLTTRAASPPLELEDLHRSWGSDWYDDFSLPPFQEPADELLGYPL